MSGWPFEDSKDYAGVTDLRPRPDSSTDGEAGELSGHPARKAGRCGVLIQYRHARDGHLRKLVWKPCRTRSCPDCGPWLRRDKLARYAERLDGWPLYLVVVAEDRWPTLQRRLNRRGAQHLRVPAAGATCAVVATIPVGEPVSDVAVVLEKLLDAQPLDKRRVTSSDAWKLSGAAAAGGDDQEQEPEWIPEGLVTAGLDRALELADELGVYLDPVNTPGPGEAHLLRFPADDPTVWRRWKRWAGLVQDLPQRRGKRRLEAA
jgi:hypothetical protein